MLLLGILTLICVLSLMSKIPRVFFNRIGFIIILFCFILSINSLNEGFISHSDTGVFNGLWQINLLNKTFDTFIYFIALLILSFSEMKTFNQYIKTTKLFQKENGMKTALADKEHNVFTEISNKKMNDLKSNPSEYSLFILLNCLGMISLISSFDLISFFLAIELQSFSLYIISTIYKNSESSTSAGLKYFLLGALSSGFILLGSSLLYGMTGITNFDSFSMLQLTSESNQIEIPLLILLTGLLFKISAAPFHNWSPDVYDGVPTLVTSWIAILPKISIIIFLITFLGLFNNCHFLDKFEMFHIPLNWNYLILISASLSLIIGSIMGLTQYRIKRLLAYSAIVRRCAFYGFEELTIFLHYPIMQTATRLGRGENPKLNVASLWKGEIRSNQDDRLALQAVTSKVKAILLKVYLQGASSVGLQLAWNRLWKMNLSMKWLLELWIILSRIVINNLNVKKGQPKEVVGPYKRTSGLPKVGNDYGNRGIVVPVNCLSSLYSPMKIGARERIPGFEFRMFCNAAGSSSTVKSDSMNKILKLAKHSRINTEIQITDPVYKLMYDQRLFEVAYHRLRSKPGNMTPGIVPTTLDGMSSEVIKDIVDKMKDQSFKFTPGKRVQIPKTNGGVRPLTVAPPRDKLVQEVMRMIIEAMFEPTFSESSHGFRAGRSCHTALKEIKSKFGVATWYIEGDISKCFDTINHNKLMEYVEQRIADRRFTRLIRKALNAGYFEFREYKHSIVGTPQGSIISPILCNIFMDKLDKMVENIKKEFDSGDKARINPAWSKFQNKKARTQDLQVKLECHKMMLEIPSRDPMDPNYKRLVYVRYADDWIIGIRGSHEDAKQILDKIDKFLNQELNLQLSLEKTLITNAQTDRALFLGTAIGRAQHTSFSSSKTGHTKRNGKEIRLEAPLVRINKKLTEASFLNGKIPQPKFIWLPNNKDEIITLYNSVYRGYINYYSFVMNFGEISSWIHYVLKTSCAKLLASKFKLESQTKVYKEFGKSLKGKDKVSFATAELKMKPWDFKVNRTDIIKTMYVPSISAASLDNLSCSQCGSTHRVEMHHVKHLKDLNPKLSLIDAMMASKRRKQIAVCRECHLRYHGSVEKAS